MTKKTSPRREAAKEQTRALILEVATRILAERGTEHVAFAADERTSFYQASLVASWVFFDGAERRSRIRQAELERLRLEVQLEETASRIGLQVREARDEATAASAAVEAADEAADPHRAGTRSGDGAAGHVHVDRARRRRSGAATPKTN